LVGVAEYEKIPLVYKPGGWGGGGRALSLKNPWAGVSAWLWRVLKGVWVLEGGLCSGLAVKRRRLTALANERAGGGFKGDAADEHIAG
jgi:hypothetical protein